MNPISGLQGFGISLPKGLAVGIGGGAANPLGDIGKGLGEKSAGGIGGLGAGLDFESILQNAANSAVAQKPVFPDGISLGRIRAPGVMDEINSAMTGNGAALEGTLRDLVAGVNAKQGEAADSVSRLLAGEQIPLHQTMIQIEEASVAFQLMVEVRNKLMESYQELMRMQI